MDPIENKRKKIKINKKPSYLYYDALMPVNFLLYNCTYIYKCALTDNNVFFDLYNINKSPERNRDRLSKIPDVQNVMSRAKKSTHNCPRVREEF